MSNSKDENQMDHQESKRLLIRAKFVYDNSRIDWLDAKAKLLKAFRALRKAQDELQTICEHKWERDPPVCQTRTSYTCSFCGKDM